MKHNLLRVSLILGASGMLAATLATSASAAPHTPSWHPILSLPNGKTANPVKTVVATGRTSGWAFPENSTVALERTGAGAWRKVALPGKTGSVQAAAASAPSSVWAARGTQLDRWNGRTWTVAKSFRGTLTGVSVLGPNDVWAFGGAASGGGVFHFNGRSWAEVSTAAFQGGSAVSDRDVWAFSGPTVAHFNGRKWTVTSLAKLFPPSGGLPVPPFLSGIVALGPGNVYATGEGYQGEGGGAAVVLHFNGRGWSRAAVGPVVVDFGESAAPDGKGGLWVVSDTHQNFQQLWHYSGGQITNVTPAEFGPLSVSRIPGTAQALAGGFALSAAVVEQYS